MAPSTFPPMRVRIGSVNRSNAQEAVIGRDGLADRLWRTLEGSSLQVLSERRMGKTWVLHLAQARELEGVFSVFLNVESLRSAPELTQRLMDTVYQEVPVLGKLDQAKGFLRRHRTRIQNQSVGSMTVPQVTNWKEDLHTALSTFQSRIGKQTPVVILDELPHLLDSIIQAGRPEEAAELLDTLRELRQAMPRLRMIYCGSLGFHIVFAKLRQTGYTGQPVNDMGTFDVPPLEAEAAMRLAGRLLTGEGVACDDVEPVAHAVGAASSRVPFYIQHMVSWMCANNDSTWTASDIPAALNRIFDATGDPFNFSYYDKRLDQYYPPEWVENARIVLDLLSRREEGYAVAELLNLVKHCEKTMGLSQDDLLKLLETLREDHYVVKADDRFRFKLEIVRQWWLTARGSLRS